MGHLCFGSFLKVLALCSPRSTTNKFLCGTLLTTIDPTYVSILDDDSAISHLFSCTNNVSPSITDLIVETDPTTVRDCFENKIIPILYVEKRANIICALIDLLFKDEEIPDSEIIGTLTSNTKEYYRLETQYDLAEVLTDFLFFVIRSCENTSGQMYIDDIDQDYIRSFDFKKDEIVLKPTGTPINFTNTSQGKGFAEEFIPVSTAEIGLKNPEDCQIFRLKIEDNEFTYRGLEHYLNRNLGRYVYSRTEVERYKDEDNLEGIGIEAAQYMRNNSTGNELADMLLYAFLEEVLGAPKLLSSIELGAPSNCAGIHLRGVDGIMPKYQLVYGSSSIEGDLKAAIDKVFDTVVNIKAKRITGEQLVNSALFDNSVDREVALYVREILVPTKQNPDPPGTAFGLFLGYSLGLKPEDYSSSQFIEEAVDKMEHDIQENALYIYKKIKDLKLSMHSFYIYVLPFNNAVEDKTNIINMLIGGGA